jgi:hypothetical protein
MKTSGDALNCDSYFTFPFHKMVLKQKSPGGYPGLSLSFFYRFVNNKSLLASIPVGAERSSNKNKRMYC